MRRPGLWLGAAVVGVLVAFSAGRPLWRVSRSWPHRVAVEGHSMEPSFRHRDWLLVDPDAYARTGPGEGALVVARDPREAHRLLIKRVVKALPGGGLVLAGDHPAHRGDSIIVGATDRGLIIGRPWLRYWPLARVRRVG